jgi:hypothetical protein
MLLTPKKKEKPPSGGYVVAMGVERLLLLLPPFFAPYGARNHKDCECAVGYEFCAGNTHLCSGVEKPSDYGAVMYAPSVAAYAAAFTVAAVAAEAAPRGPAILALSHNF